MGPGLLVLLKPVNQMAQKNDRKRESVAFAHRKGCQEFSTSAVPRSSGTETTLFNHCATEHLLPDVVCQRAELHGRFIFRPVEYSVVLNRNKLRSIHCPLSLIRGSHVLPIAGRKGYKAEDTTDGGGVGPLCVCVSCTKQCADVRHMSRTPVS